MTNNKTNNKDFFKEYNNEIYAKTKKYQKKYGFEIGEGKHDAWNNEADAFKHAFMQADLALKSTSGLSKLAGDYHELEGELKHQPIAEKNMDLWNNEIGRKIAKEIRKEGQHRLIKRSDLDDIIAEKVVQRMRKGELITHPSDPRKYKSPKQKFDEEIRAKYRALKEKSNRKLNQIFRSSKPNKTSGNKGNSGLGRWVTINGNHVFLD